MARTEGALQCFDNPLYLLGKSYKTRRETGHAILPFVVIQRDLQITRGMGLLASGTQPCVVTTFNLQITSENTYEAGMSRYRPEKSQLNPSNRARKIWTCETEIQTRPGREAKKMFVLPGEKRNRTHKLVPQDSDGRSGRWHQCNAARASIYRVWAAGGCSLLRWRSPESRMSMGSNQM